MIRILRSRGESLFSISSIAFLRSWMFILVIEKHLTEDMVVIPEFNDGFIRRMVTSIRVTQDNNLQICIKGGYEIMASFPCDKNAA